MGVHVEWARAPKADERPPHTIVEAVPSCTMFSDGQSIEAGNCGLVIEGSDVVVIEGTPDELRALLRRWEEALPKPVEHQLAQMSEEDRLAFQRNETLLKLLQGGAHLLTQEELEAEYRITTWSPIGAVVYVESVKDPNQRGTFRYTDAPRRFYEFREDD